MISIIVPVKNRVTLLSETIDSVLSQNDGSWELLLVDDYSDAKSFKQIELLAEKNERVKLHRKTTEEKGASVSRNIGLKLASHDWVVFLDSDDLIGSAFIENRINTLAHQDNENMDLLIFPVITFKKVPGDSEVLWNSFSGKDDLFRFLNLDPVWHTTSPLWKKSSLISIGGFLESLPCWQDWELHSRALIAGLSYKKITNIDIDIFYRRHQQSAISDQSNKVEYLRGKFEAIKSIEDTLTSTDRELFNFALGKSYFSIIRELREAHFYCTELESQVKNHLINAHFLSKTALSLWNWRLNHALSRKSSLSVKLFDKYVFQKHGNHFLQHSQTYLRTRKLLQE